MTTIRHPEWITLSVNGESHFGYDQEWYPQKRQKLAGCGPTVGAMTVAYVERKHKGVSVATRDEAEKIMLRIWKYATPRMHGLYKPRWLGEGLNGYFRDENLPFRAEVLSVSSVRLLAPPLDKVKAFIEEGIRANAPVAFLNLHSGGEPIPYHWHWMLLVGLEEKDGRILCTLWDEGKEYIFDLPSWLSKTKFGGGFVRIVGL